MAVHKTPGKANLKVKVPSGSVVIETAVTDRTEIDVMSRRDSEDGRRLLEEVREVCRETSPGHLEVDLEVPSPRRGKWWEFLIQSPCEFDVHVKAPEGTELEVETISADVRGNGSFGCADEPPRERGSSRLLRRPRCRRGGERPLRPLKRE